LLAACGQSTSAPSPTPTAPKAADTFDPEHVVIAETPECVRTIQRDYGVSNPELWVMTHDPNGYVCPNAGVSEARIREIAGLWEKAGCHKHTAAELLSALDKHQCGGDAG
ncbi:MAG TPA: hypothetical protein VG942_19505, partial [Hyphomonadaceae bacterium]|nr:hypothetical protein [Hyphomonadaceae bacterium]